MLIDEKVFKLLKVNKFYYIVIIIFFSLLIILKGAYLKWYINNNPYYKVLLWDSIDYEAIAKSILQKSFWKGDVFIIPPGYPNALVTHFFQ